MNALPLPQPGDARTYAQSWAFSVLLHGLAVGVSITLASDLTLGPQPEPFKWEVSVVEAPRPKPVDTPAPTPAKPAPAVPKPVETRPVETQPVIRSGQAQTVQMVQQVVGPEVVRAVSPVVQASTRSTQMISRTVQAVQAQQPVVPVATETVMDAEDRPVARESAIVPTSQVVTTVTKHVIANASLLPPAEPAVISRTVAEEPQATATELPVKFSPATRPDYGWLAEALWNKIEQLKRYPRTARSNRWEGTVVLQAVIKADGYLQDLTVVESSGHPLLDRDAQETLRQACPLKLKHAMGQPLVVVHVPISYRLDQ
jgi:protein TonB